MSKPEELGLIQYLSEVVNQTKSGTIEWLRANPTTYTWTKMVGGPVARMTIQRIEKPEVVRSPNGGVALQQTRNYVLQVTDAQANLQILSLNTTETPAMMDILAELYESIGSNVSQKSMEFLRNMLKN
jgi:hypothetical protein